LIIDQPNFVQFAAFNEDRNEQFLKDESLAT